MRKTILAFSFFISSLSLFSQQDAVLKNFKFRNVNYRAIILSIGGNGQYSNEEYALRNASSHSSSVSLGAEYYMLKSTDKILLSVTGSLSVSGSFNKSTLIPGYQKNSNLYFSPGLHINDKWFFKKLFVELGADIGYNTYSSKSDYKDIVLSTSESKQHAYSLAPIAGIGTGRLENVRDMQNALWLNKALEKEGRLSHSLSSEELNELGNAIVAANNTRVLDSRKRTQFILETVNNYFQQKGLAGKTDIKYFSNLNDILFFAINDPRLSGTETYIRFTPALDHYFGEQSQIPSSVKNEDDYTTRSANLSVGISRYRPLNLHHQNNYGLSLQMRTIFFHRINTFANGGPVLLDIKTTIKQAGLNLFVQHVIYPNTRTAISFDLRSEGGYQDVNNESKFFGTGDLSVLLNYFISYRTRFTGGIGANWRKNFYGSNNYDLVSMPDNVRLYASAGLQVNL